MRAAVHPTDPQHLRGFLPATRRRPTRKLGEAEYLEDIAAGMKGMLYAKVLRSPYPHARIKSMDTSRPRPCRVSNAVLRYDDPEVAASGSHANAWTSVNSGLARPDVLPEHQGPQHP